MQTPGLTSYLVRWEEAFTRGVDLPAKDLCSDHPELAPPLQAAIDVLKRLDLPGMMQQGEEPDDSSRPEKGPASTVVDPRDEGEAGIVPPPGYDLLGTLGEGGMGIVCKARHRTLDRIVALKMIRHGSARADDLVRFRTEAEAIARLQHPNIVQVFEVGESQGRPYFSLEFCPGGSLDRKLAGTPLPAQEAATLVAQLARAIQAAHDARVIHRDLKPANVLLQKEEGGRRRDEKDLPDSASSFILPPSSFLESFVPKITDFGLARKLDEVGHTRHGDVFGTPSYMAPEQASGDPTRIGPAVDIYALGAILYECLTGRPPFRAATVYDTLLEVVSKDPVPPRQLNSQAPLDLETICLKCLHKEPTRRYLTARDLADDLARYREGLPILARPIGPVERTTKWVRRRPAVAGLLASLAVVTLAALIVITWLYGEAVREATAARSAESVAEKESRTARKERDRAEEKRKEALAHLATARQAVDECFLVARFNPLLQADSMRQVRRLLLEKALPFYQGFLERMPESPDIQREIADQHNRVGFITLEIGRKSDAAELYRKSRAGYQKLTQVEPKNHRHQAELATVCTALGLVLSDLGQHQEARDCYEEARGIQERLVASYPHVAAVREDLARTLGNLGNLQQQLGQLPEALATREKAHDLLRVLVREDPKESMYRIELAIQLTNLAQALGHREDPRALPMFQEAQGLLAGLVADGVGGDYPLEVLAVSDNRRGVLLARLGRPAESLASYLQAREGMRQLVGRSPEVTRYARELARACSNLGNLLRDQGRPDEAVKAHLEARDHLARQMQAHPEDPGCQHDLAGVWSNLSLALRDRNRLHEALLAIDQAIHLAQGLVTRSPESTEASIMLARAWNNRANILERQGLPALALVSAHKARDVCRQVLREHPEEVEGRDQLATTHDNLASIQDALGRYEEALAEYLQAGALLRVLVAAKAADVRDLTRRLGEICINQGVIQHRLGKLKDAVASYNEGQTRYQQLANATPGHREYRARLGTVCTNRGAVLHDLGKPEEALACFDEAIAIRRKLLTSDPEDPELQEELATSLGARSQMLAQAKRLKECLVSLDESILLFEKAGKHPTHRGKADRVRLRGTLQIRARVLAGLDRPRDALADWDRIVELSTGPERFSSRMGRADALARVGVYRRAIEEADELARAEKLPGEACYDLACVLALAATAARADPTRPLPEREKLAEEQARQAVRLLERARAAGHFADRERRQQLDQDEDLECLRPRSDFRRLREGLK